jgi:hypothetical protein
MFAMPAYQARAQAGILYTKYINKNFYTVNGKKSHAGDKGRRRRPPGRASAVGRQDSYPDPSMYKAPAMLYNGRSRAGRASPARPVKKWQRRGAGV